MDENSSKRRRVSESGRAEDSPDRHTLTDRPHEHKRPAEHHSARILELDGIPIVLHKDTPSITTGSFCDVFTGHHKSIGKVALKRPRIGDDGCSEDQVRHFEEEARIWKTLSHPNILEFVGVVYESGHIWLISPFAENGCLPKYIAAHPDANRATFVAQLACGIAYLHSMDVVHGDIKGNNILISNDVRVLVCDFGLAKMAGTATASSQKGIGNARWQAPEVLEGGSRTVESDIYAFGITISEILSGKIPFHQYDGPITLISAILNNERPIMAPTESPGGERYDALWRIGMRCWDQDMRARPGMGAIHKELNSLSALVGNVSDGAANTMAESASAFGKITLPDTGSFEDGLSHKRDSNLAIGTFRVPHLTRRQPAAGSDGSSLERHEAPEQQWDFIRQIPRVNAKHDALSRSGANSCFPDTRLSVLKVIFDWIDNPNPDAPSIFWLCGAPGIGKSAVAQSVAERLEGEQRLGASFFFSRNEAERSDARLFFPTIAYQLAQHNATFREKLTGRLRRDFDVVLGNMAKQMQELVSGPLSFCVDDSDTKIVIVVDALDECSSESEVTQILSLWASKMWSVQRNVRLFVTSRPYWHIEKAFRTAGLKDISKSMILHDIERSLVREDIELFLQHHLKDIAKRYGLRDWPKQADIQILVDVVDGLFIIAATIVRFLDSDDWLPQDQLQAVLDSLERGGRSHAHRDIDALYRGILRVAASGTDNDIELNHIVSRYQKVVGTIILACEALSPKSIDDLLQLPVGTSRIALRRLHSVIAIPIDDDSPAQVLHPTFPELLLDSNRCTDPRFSINESTGHSLLALRCLITLNEQLKADICGIGKNSCAEKSEVSDLTTKVEQCIPPYLRYACRNFSIHLSKAAEEEELLKHAEEFFQNKLLMWLEVLSLIQAVGGAMEALQRILRWYSLIHDPSEQVLAILHDARRFVLRFRGVIDSYPQQVYLSALIWAPNCTLRNVYLPETSRKRWIVNGHETGWTSTLQTFVGPVTPTVVCSTGAPFMAIYGRMPHVGDGTARISKLSLVHLDTGDVVAEKKDIRDFEAVAVSPDGMQVAYKLSDESHLQLWNIQTGVVILTTAMGLDSVFCAHSMEYGRDSTRLATLTSRNTFRHTYNVTVWDIQALTQLHHIDGDGFDVLRQEDIIVTIAGTRIALYDLETGDAIRSFQCHSGHPSEIKCFSFGDDARAAVVVHRAVFLNVNYAIAITDLHTGTCLAILDLGSHVFGLSVPLSVSPFRRIAYTLAGPAGSGNRIHIHHDTELSTQLVSVGSSMVSSLAFAHDDSAIAVGTAEGVVRLVDIGASDEPDNGHGLSHAQSPPSDVSLHTNTSNSLAWMTVPHVDSPSNKSVSPTPPGSSGSLNDDHTPMHPTSCYMHFDSPSGEFGVHIKYWVEKHGDFHTRWEAWIAESLLTPESEVRRLAYFENTLPDVVLVPNTENILPTVLVRFSADETALSIFHDDQIGIWKVSDGSFLGEYTEAEPYCTDATGHPLSKVRERHLSPDGYRLICQGQGIVYIGQVDGVPLQRLSPTFLAEALDEIDMGLVPDATLALFHSVTGELCFVRWGQWLEVQMELSGEWKRLMWVPPEWRELSHDGSAIRGPRWVSPYLIIDVVGRTLVLDIDAIMKDVLD